MNAHRNTPSRPDFHRPVREATVPDRYDYTDPQQARRMVRARLAPLSFDQMLERDLARRVLALMDRRQAVPDLTPHQARDRLHKRHEYLLSRRPNLAREVDQALAAEPGSDQWRRLAWRFEARRNGEDVL